MSEDPVFREAEFLEESAPLPVLSPGLRSRVLAAALEAQDRRSQGRRVLASSLGLFALLAGVAWMEPFSASDTQTSVAGSLRFDGQGFSEPNVSGKLVDVQRAGQVAGKQAAGAAASSALSSFNRGQGLMSVMGDDWQSVEEQLQSRQEHFSRFHM